MLTQEELTELRNAIEGSRRPLIFFDDDTDGLAAFLLIYKFAQGFSEDIKGVPVKDNPVLRSSIFLRKIEEFNPDRVFVLDKPIIDQEFLDNVKQDVYWLDHHPLVERGRVKYFNPLKHHSTEYNPDNRPTSYWAYKTLEDFAKNHLWIAMFGCIGDWFVPEFAKEFHKQYPDLLPWNSKIKNPGYVLHETKLGRLCRIIQFNMKCSTEDALKSMKIMTRIGNPYEILEQQTPQGRFIYDQYEKIHRIYERIKSEMKKNRGKLILYIYKEKFALTGDLANEIQYYNPDKVVLIAREKEDEMVCSIRSQNIEIRDILKKSLIGIQGHGGGHAHACGCGIKKSDFPAFIVNMKKNLKEAVAEHKKAQKRQKKV